VCIALFFFSYDFTRVQLTSSEDLASGKPTSMRTALLAGSVAGIATWVSTFPFGQLLAPWVPAALANAALPWSRHSLISLNPALSLSLCCDVQT
jgi:hypothetical protein